MFRPLNALKSAPRHKREGAAAVEFALVGLPFFLMLFSIFEIGMVFLVDTMAETAVVKASRMIRTGEAKTQGFDAGKFKQAFCSNMGVLQNDCASRTTVDVRVVTSFKDDLNETKTNGVPDKTGYDGGDAQDLILVRIWYRQPMITPLLTQAVSNGGAGNVIISSTTAFRNEPWNA